MQSSAREEILSRIRNALKHSSSSEPLRPDLERVSAGGLEKLTRNIKERCAERREDLINRFELELTRVGGKFRRFNSRNAAGDYICELAESKGANLTVGWNSVSVEHPEIIASLKASSINFIADDGETRPNNFISAATDAGLGISGVDYALSDTGTLVLLAAKGRARSASLLPPVHVALVRPDQFIAGLDDLFPLLRYELESSVLGLSSAVTFITGPSRTADIELTLVVGVHGPQELHVVLLDLE